MSRIKARWYSYEKNPYDYIRNPETVDKTLYSNGKYRTKITAKDLPDSFVYGRFYKRWGYVDTAGIKDMKYIPNMWINHFLKDDRLILSYTGKLNLLEHEDMWTKYENEDFCVWGNEIIDVLKGAKKFSGIDISSYITQIRQKLVTLKQTYPEEFGDYNPDIDGWLNSEMIRHDGIVFYP